MGYHFTYTPEQLDDKLSNPLPRAHQKRADMNNWVEDPSIEGVILKVTALQMQDQKAGIKKIQVIYP